MSVRGVTQKNGVGLGVPALEGDARAVARKPEGDKFVRGEVRELVKRLGIQRLDPDVVDALFRDGVGHPLAVGHHADGGLRTLVEAVNEDEFLVVQRIESEDELLIRGARVDDRQRLAVWGKIRGPGGRLQHTLGSAPIDRYAFEFLVVPEIIEVNPVSIGRAVRVGFVQPKGQLLQTCPVDADAPQIPTRLCWIVRRCETLSSESHK